MENVCAIIVSHNPDERLKANINKIILQDVHIVVIDNASTKNCVKLISAFKKNQNVTIIKNSINVGLATALNQGVRYAIEKKYKWVATFDQDSIITNCYFKNMLEVFDVCSDNHTVAIIAPVYKDQTTGNIQSFKDHNSIDANSLFSFITTTNTSGNLILVDVFKNIGLFRDDFIIDYIDKEFCLRCKQCGYNIVESNHTYLLHNVGNPRQHKLLWKTPISSNHTPLRRYYITRNRLIVYKKYFKLFPYWVLKDYCSMIREIIKVFVYERDKTKKILFICKGAKDAFLNRLGLMDKVSTMHLYIDKTIDNKDK